MTDAERSHMVCYIITKDRSITIDDIDNIYIDIQGDGFRWTLKDPDFFISGFVDNTDFLEWKRDFDIKSILGDDI